MIQYYYGVLIHVSTGYPPVKGRLHTRYAPVRHSFKPESLITVRLACIKPAASVHPEPGSNSPYYFLVFLFRSSLFTIDYLPILPAVSNIFLRTKLPQHSFYAFLPTPLLSLFFATIPAKFLPLVSKGDCKCHTILPTYQTFLQKIFKRFRIFMDNPCILEFQTLIIELYCKKQS